MTAWLGWALAAVAMVVGYLRFGWQGLAVALTITVFWLLLQFSRALRVLHTASANPMGRVPNAVMLQARLSPGMRLPDVLKLTKSLGRKLGDDPETYAWTDGAGDTVQLQLRDGRVTQWQLLRDASGQAPQAGA